MANIKSFSQECNVSTENQKSWISRYETNIAQRQIKHRSTLIQLPLVFHIVNRSNGSGGVTADKCLNAVCDLNELYTHAAIQFYFPDAGIRFINDDGIFNTPYQEVNKLKMRSLQEEAINVFIVNKVSDNNALGVYDSKDDWILLQKGAIATGDKTLAHEIGHFFSLLHTHFGWEGRPWIQSYDGSIATSLSFDGSTATELVNRTNCSSSGDMLCDTPADYNFGLNYQKSCNFSGNALDPTGTKVAPDESLIMSYFHDSCRTSFSEEQVLIMRADVENEKRYYLTKQTIPSTQALVGLPTLIEPTNQILSDKLPDSLIFAWNSVVGASHYYLVFDRSNKFNLDPKGFITDANNISIGFDWLENTSYYWKVQAYNQQNMCSQPSEVTSFLLGISTGLEDEVFGSGIEVSFLNQRLSINWKGNLLGVKKAFIYNSLGQKIHELSTDNFQNQETATFMLDECLAGIYYLSLVGDNKIVTKRFFGNR